MNTAGRESAPLSLSRQASGLGLTPHSRDAAIRAVEQLTDALRARSPTHASMPSVPVGLFSPLDQSCVRRIKRLAPFKPRGSWSSAAKRSAAEAAAEDIAWAVSARDACLHSVNTSMSEGMVRLASTRRLPVVSMLHTLSPLLASTPVGPTGSGLSELLQRFTRDYVHFTFYGHLLAALMLDGLLAEAARLAAKHLARGRDPCRRRPSAGTGGGEAGASSPRSCAVGEALKPLVVGASGFAYTVEWSLQGNPKPGYVGGVPGAALHLCQPRPHSRGGRSVIDVGHLVSFDGMGRGEVACWADCSCAPTRFDSHWKRQNSVGALKSVKVAWRDRGQPAQAAAADGPSSAHCGGCGLTVPLPLALPRFERGRPGGAPNAPGCQPSRR